MLRSQRKTKLLLAAVVSALLAALACGPQTPAPDPAAEKVSADEEKAAIDEIRAKYIAAENAGDAAALAELYTENGVYMPANAPAAEGRSAIQSSYEGMFKQYKAQADATPVSVVEITGDWAFERGTFKTTLTPVDGGDPVEDAGKYVVVTRKTGDGWKVHYLIWNSDNPPPGASQ